MLSRAAELPSVWVVLGGVVSFPKFVGRVGLGLLDIALGRVG